MKIATAKSGTYLQEDIYKYTLSNDNNVEISVLSYGGTITDITIPDKDSGLRNIVLALDCFESYINNPLYPGATLGPNAGRLQDGVLKIGSNTYLLSRNDGNHNLHGGFVSVSYMNWIKKR